VVKVLIDIRNGNGVVWMISITWVIGVCAVLVKWPKTSSVLVWCV
jgi:hypothetical protein